MSEVLEGTALLSESIYKLTVIRLVYPVGREFQPQKVINMKDCTYFHFHTFVPNAHTRERK